MPEGGRGRRNTEEKTHLLKFSDREFQRRRSQPMHLNNWKWKYERNEKKFIKIIVVGGGKRVDRGKKNFGF